MKHPLPVFAGIDYGSKLAGTTVIALYEAGSPVRMYQCEKKKDADKFLLSRLIAERPTEIFLDAPLSLPGIYRDLPGCTDYFYRRSDRELRAMSPMFLGGLTARAIKLKDELTQEGFSVREVYPAALAKLLKLKDLGYKNDKKNLAACTDVVQTHYDLRLPRNLDNWHQFDALLALASGMRFLHGEHRCAGDAEEGLIIF